MSATEPSKCPACAAGLWTPNCTYSEPSDTDWRAAALCLEVENADLREQLTLNRDTLQRRTDAMHRVAQENDHLRSRLANQETTP